MWGLVSQTFNEFLEDKAERLGAALAYYAVFSISPLLIIVVALVDLLYAGDSLAHIRNQIAMMLGDNAAEAIVATIRGVNSSSSGVTATIISIVTLLIGSTAVFTQLQDAMNTILGVTPKPRRYITEMVRSRVISFAMVAGITFLLLVSLIISATLSAIGAYFKSILPGTELLWQSVDFLVSFAVTTALFAMMYKVLPDVKIAYRDVWIGRCCNRRSVQYRKNSDWLLSGPQHLRIRVRGRRVHHGASGVGVLLLSGGLIGSRIYSGVRQQLRLEGSTCPRCNISKRGAADSTGDPPLPHRHATF
jgi:YihY family inner membrane protein